MISLSGLSVSYDGAPAVRMVDLDVDEGNLCVLLGPSGCGKSTLLRTLAGLIKASAGRIVVGGEDITALQPEQRRLGFVFQNYALFPHLTARENVGFGLAMQGWPRSSRGERVDEMLDLVGLRHLGDRRPSELSGGQQQRVAIARAMAPRPRVLLFDEPLSNLDAQLRVSLRDDIRALQRRLGITSIFVTHDREEALALADKIAVMKDGKIVQVADPRTLYDKPADPFVCRFMGDIVALPKAVRSKLRGAEGSDCFVRPEDVVLRPHDGLITFQATVTSSSFLGAFTRVLLAVDGDEIEAFVLGRDSQGAEPGTVLTAGIDPARVLSFPTDAPQ